tara:strand:- start:41 stop:535 length:495 start_codon:yes stop_codon:yes gene_type:complete
MKTYYIYHIAGIKIGCTSDLLKRMSDQGFTEWEILEEHSDIYEVSDREIQIQKDYSLPVDKVPYWKSVQNRHTWDDVARAKGQAVLKEGKYKHVTKASHVAAKGKKKITYDIAQQIRSEGWVSKKNQFETGPTLKEIAKKYNTTVAICKGVLHNKSYTSPDWRT